MKVIKVVSVIEVWKQVSANYDAAKQTKTKTFAPDTPIHEIIEWAKSMHTRGLGTGDLIITWEVRDEG